MSNKIRLHDGYKRFLDVCAGELPVIVTGYTRYTTIGHPHEGYRWVTITQTMYAELRTGAEPVVQFERKEIKGHVRTIATLTERGKKVRIQGWFMSGRR